MPDFLRTKKSRQNVISKWAKQSYPRYLEHFSETEDTKLSSDGTKRERSSAMSYSSYCSTNRQTLWLIVTGLDMLLTPLQIKTHIKALSKQAARLSDIDEENKITEKSLVKDTNTLQESTQTTIDWKAVTDNADLTIKKVSMICYRCNIYSLGLIC